jgi:hypothetical protein
MQWPQLWAGDRFTATRLTEGALRSGGDTIIDKNALENIEDETASVIAYGSLLSSHTRSDRSQVLSSS